MITREEYAEQNRSRVRGRRVDELRNYLQSALPAEFVTGMREWDSYLQLLQGAVEATQKKRDELTIRMQSPDVVDPNVLMRLKIELLRCQERVGAFQAAMSLPKQLVEGKEGAQVELDELAKENGNEP